MDPYNYTLSLYFTKPLPGDLNGPFFLLNDGNFFPNQVVVFICGTNITYISLKYRTIISTTTIQCSTGESFKLKQVVHFSRNNSYGIAEINQTNYWISLDLGQNPPFVFFLNLTYLLLFKTGNGILTPLNSLASLQFPNPILAPALIYIDGLNTALITGSNGCTLTLIKTSTGSIISSSPLDYGIFFPCGSTNSLKFLLNWIS